MKKIFFISAIISISMIACSSHQKKILVFASSDIQVDNTQKNISVSEGTTHNEKELEFSGSDPITLNIQSPAGKFIANATEDGFYILNLQKDTVVGSYQHIGTESNTRISQEQLKLRLDSLNQLVLGQNVNADNKNYFILPGKISKISTNVKSKVFGPYTSIPSSFDATNIPEVYKFYTNQEMREIIGKLSPMLK
ncbi:MAG TPA: hypothetical protein VMI12_10510 [Puia sp.]|nr:hypothetical protein [Puia sp.]